MLQGRSYKEAVNQTQQLIKGIGMTDLTYMPIINLSNGQRRILSVAYSLMKDPEIWILDEPTAGLDVVHRRQVMNLISS
jgi:ABC-2 type transport system ATP-binding protein